MQHQKKHLATACNVLRMTSSTGVSSTPKNLQLKALAASLDPNDLNHPEMERRMRAKAVWEFLDEGKSTFHARRNPNDAVNFDPLFPKPIPSSSTGKGPMRWKLGAVITWLRRCEANASHS